MSSSTTDPRPPREVFTVSQLNREVRTLLEGQLPLLWVAGEISNLARPASGHLYFTLKDSAAQVRCAMFRTRSAHTGVRLENGLEILARARVGLYEPRGDYQLIVEHIEEAGDGRLRRAFDQLKAQLAAEGLFDAAHKRPLPHPPRRLGIVTSASGAALHDILTVLHRRYRALPVVIYPTQVQGRGAAEQIAATIRLAGERAECDLLIVGRGGGSLEDLWAFNEEPVARAIYTSPIPVVSAVGHEIDFTIADFVADVRAPTPSAAAELVSLDSHALLHQLHGTQQRLLRGLEGRLGQRRRELALLERRLKHPGRRLQELAQRVDELELRLGRAARLRVAQTQGRVRELAARLARHTPQHRIERLDARREELYHRLSAALERRHTALRQRLAVAARALEAVSPLATLARGYAIVSDEQGRVLHRVTEAKQGGQISARLEEGRLICRIEEVLHEKT